MDVTPLLDPEIATLLSGAPPQRPLDVDRLPEFRASMLAMFDTSALSDAVTRTDHTLTASDGHRFTIRTHRAATTAPEAPALVWLHGGGLVAGTYLQDDGRFDRWCQTLGIIGVSVDYGLAPERPYPGPLNDCYAALAWVHDNAEALGARPDAVGVGGSSAGGGLAAGLCLLARDRGEQEIAFQALLYPMLDDRMTTVSSRWDVPIWPPASNEFGWSSYLQGRRGASDIPAYAAPARATELKGLPPTYIGVGALDGFFDEDIDFARRLIHAGVPVELHVYPGAPHGFDLLPDARLTRRARAHLAQWLDEALAGLGSPVAEDSDDR